MSGFTDTFLPLILASAILIWGLIFLIKVLSGLDNEKLKTWLDFGKYFLGTFVLGVLGYFAKASFDKRNLAILESDQIGKYVEQALADDVALRLRFADYFNTVLPMDDRNARWDEYVVKLRKEQEQTEIAKAAVSQSNEIIDSLSAQLEDTTVAIADKTIIRKELDKLFKEVEKEKTVIDQSQKIGTVAVSQAASIRVPNSDFFTTRSIVKNKPGSPREVFKKGKVWVFARVYAPRDEQVTINWRDYEGNLLPNGTKNYVVKTNTISGYRISTYKNIPDIGGYSVELINGDGVQIGVVNFEVTN